MASAAGTQVRTTPIPEGVPALRAGQGTSFWLRRLHSLSGIFPVGAFILEHFISNAFATNGVKAYNEQVRFLTSFPFVIFLEIFFIYIPIAYHSLYGFYIWYRGDSNAGPAYPWFGNWMYTAQRWTGIVTFFYMGYHVWTMRFSGVHLLTDSAASFTKVYDAFNNPWVVAFYFVGITAASWHFGYGVWLFAAKWGLVPGQSGRRKFGYLCAAFAVVLVIIGYATMAAFLTTPAAQVPSITAEHALLH